MKCLCPELSLCKILSPIVSLVKLQETERISRIRNSRCKLINSQVYNFLRKISTAPFKMLSFAEDGIHPSPRAFVGGGAAEAYGIFVVGLLAFASKELNPNYSGMYHAFEYNIHLPELPGSLV